MSFENIFLKSYLNEVEEKEKKKNQVTQDDRKIAAIKEKKLAPIIEFLQKFVDFEVFVKHRDQATHRLNQEGIQGEKFSFYLQDSSKKWYPGVSIMFDHPAEIEIAIPHNQKEDGIVVIKVASNHPDAYILEQYFSSYESACEALSRFLAKSTVRIGKKYKIKENKSIMTQEKNYDFTNDVPDEAPDAITPKKIGDMFHLRKEKNSDEE